MKILLSTIIAIISISSAAHAQLEKVKSLALSNILIASVDRLGNFYFVLPSGKIRKYNPEGELIDESSVSVLPITIIEPWNPLEVFTYSNQTKQYHHWDHHLQLLEEKTLEASLSITPHLVCPSNEAHKAWVLDVADLSLKKVNLISNEIDLDVPLSVEWTDGNHNWVFMREYQNRIFLLDKNKGILMLNNLGKLITSIKIEGLNFFNFLGEELCYRNGNDILLFDLFTGETRKVATLQNTKSIRYTIITDERLVVVYDTSVEIYSFAN